MEITVDKNWRIISEELNWIVQSKVKKPYMKKGARKLTEWDKKKCQKS